MKQTRKWILILIVAVAALLVSALRNAELKEELVFTESLGLTAVVIDGEKIALSEMAFYIAHVEREIEEKAYVYETADTGEFWKLYHRFRSIRKAGRETAMDMAVHDAILYRLAEEEGIRLDDAEQKRLASFQYDFWSDLDEEQRSALGVSEDVIKESMRKLALAEKYQYLLAAMAGEDTSAYALGGAAYETLLEEHKVEIKKNVWDRIPFGGITVNH